MDSMLLFFYNEILDEEVENLLKKLNIEGFSKIENVKGKGKTSGYHLGNSIFPDTNNLLIIVGEKEKMDNIKEEFKRLKEKYREEGAKIFVLPVSEVY